MFDPTLSLYQSSLGITEPWKVTEVRFNPEAQQLDITLDFPEGAHFVCPSCGRADCGVYDTEKRSWRHLNFFQHASYLHARAPRVWCYTCGVKTVALPWTRPKSGFTRMFEAYIVTLAREMPVNAIARLVGEHDTRLWRIIHHYVDQARSREQFKEVKEVTVDETSAAKGHSYVTVFTDPKRAKVLYVTPGKDAATVTAFAQDFKVHGGDPQQVQRVCSDLSPAFLAGMQQEFPNASHTFDKFHVSKLLGDAVDQVRREEQKSHPELKHTRYIWLKNKENLKGHQRMALYHKSLQNLKTVKAYQLRLNFQALWQQPAEEAEKFLNEWYNWATHSLLEPMIKAAKTIRKHQVGILEWFQSRLSNGLSEGLNSLIQSTKRRVRGYRSITNFITMIYLTLGKLDLGLPT